MSIQAEKTAAKAIDKSIGKLFSEILESNRPIVDAFDNLTGINSFVGDLLSEEGKFNLEHAAKKAGYLLGEGAESSVNLPKVAGAYIGGSAIGRVVSGGGIYKDRNGETNILGIPFI